MRIRCAAIIEIDGKIALMKRIRNKEEYYVFPGGGLESGETPEEAAIREIKEELGIDIVIEKLITTVSFNSLQYYFKGNYIQGEFGTGDGEEYNQTDQDRGIYIPVLIEKDHFQYLNIRLKEILPLI